MAASQEMPSKPGTLSVFEIHSVTQVSTPGPLRRIFLCPVSLASISLQHPLKTGREGRGGGKRGEGKETKVERCSNLCLDIPLFSSRQTSGNKFMCLPLSSPMRSECQQDFIFRGRAVGQEAL